MKVNKKCFNVIFKLSIFSLVFALLFSLNTTNANAMLIKDFTVDTDKVAKIVKLKNVNVSIFEDGRIKPINNPESLTNEERTSIMKLMKFTDDEIEYFPDELINEILVDGGVKVELTQEDFVHTYTDLQGNEHIVTPETMDEVNEIKLRDSQLMGSKFNLNSNIGTLDMERVEDGIYRGWGALTYLGKTSNGVNYEYSYRTGWQFNSKPFFTLTDTVAHTWQYHTTSVSTTASYDRYSNGYFGHSNRLTIDNSNVAGSKAKIDLASDPGRHYGYLTDIVRIPVAGNTGTQGQFASAYGHSHYPYNVAINIGGYGAISFSGGAGDKWDWKNNFIIGEH